MKSFKIVLGTVVVAVLGLFASSFTSSYTANAFAKKCYYYNAPTSPFKKRVVGTGSDVIVASEIRNPANWSTVAPVTPDVPPGTCAAGDFLCSICFEEDNTDDGDGDGALTLEEVVNDSGSNLDIVMSYYTAHSTLPHGTLVNINTGTTVVNSYQQTSTAQH